MFLIDGSFKKPFDAVEPAFALRTMASAAFGQGLFKLLEQLALMLSQFDRRFDLDMRGQITRHAGARTRDPFAAQPERLAGLGAFRHGKAGTASARWHFDLAAERSNGECNRNLAMQIIAIALKDRMPFKWISTYKSPGGPPPMPGSPLPFERIRMPSSIPAGILTASVLICLTLPTP